MPQGWDLGMLGVKNFSVGICDGAPSTARSSCCCEIIHCLSALTNSLATNTNELIYFDCNKQEMAKM